MLLDEDFIPTRCCCLNFKNARHSFISTDQLRRRRKKILKLQGEREGGSATGLIIYGMDRNRSNVETILLHSSHSDSSTYKDSPKYRSSLFILLLIFLYFKFLLFVNCFYLLVLTDVVSVAVGSAQHYRSKFGISTLHFSSPIYRIIVRI